MGKIIYFDNNATTPLDPKVLEAMTQELVAAPHNPSSIHSLGQEAKKVLTKARKTIADFLKVKPSEVLFTSSGTEAMNLLIHGILDNPKVHIIGSKTDHACVYHALLELQKRGSEITFLGLPTLSEIKKALRPDTRLIVLSAVNAETGYKLDLESIAKVAKTAHIPLIIDGVALLGKEPFTIPEGVVGMGFSAHKFHGPQGVGFAFVRSGTKLSPIFYGGGQERRLRSGTENLPGIVGLAKAISLLNDESYTRLKALRDVFEAQLKKMLPDIEINSAGERTSNTSNIYFPHVDNESLIIALDMENIAASSTSACASGALEPSRALIAMGFSKEHAKCSVRFSFSRMNTEEEIQKGVEVITKCVEQLQAHLNVVQN
jgi:cysteine desulfurase